MCPKNLFVILGEIPNIIFDDTDWILDQGSNHYIGKGNLKILREFLVHLFVAVKIGGRISNNLDHPYFCSATFNVIEIPISILEECDCSKLNW